MVNAPDTLDRLRIDLKRAFKIIDDRRPGYEQGAAMYLGNAKEVSASRTVKALIEKNADAYPISLAHIPVDVIANKVELASLTAKEPAPAKMLERFLDDNDLEDEVDDWITKACYLGDYYAIVDPALEDNEGRALIEGLTAVGASPFTTVVVYDRRDARTPLYGVRRWEGGGGVWHARVFYDDSTVKLITGEGMQAVNSDDFRLDYDPRSEEPEDAYIEHEGGRMLIEHLAIGSKPYGTPIHVKAYGPQQAITKISAVNLSNVDGQGFASRWALADPMAEIDDDMDDDFGTDGPDSATTGGGTTGRDGRTEPRTTSRVRTIPGAIALLRGVKQTGQYESTETENFLKNLDWYVRVMAVACGIPLFEFDLTGDQPSGESRRRAEGRANRTARKVQRAAASFLKNLGDTVLAVLGTAGTVTATFNPLETSTDKEGIELVGEKIKVGVPVRQALLEAGYTDEQVDEWWPNNAPAVPMVVLEVLALAMQQLGQAQTLGVISDVELADMLPTILTGARREGLDVPRPTSIPGVVQPARPQLAITQG